MHEWLWCWISLNCYCHPHLDYIILHEEGLWTSTLPKKSPNWEHKKLKAGSMQGRDWPHFLPSGHFPFHSQTGSCQNCLKGVTIVRSYKRDEKEMGNKYRADHPFMYFPVRAAMFWCLKVESDRKDHLV